jgi:hypothetical protein
VYDCQFNSADLDAISAFENIFDLAVMQFIVDETSRYAQQKIKKISTVSHFALGVGSGKMLQ